MSKAPKYSFRVVEKRNKSWTAEIQRQATSKKKVVSKRQTGFASEAEGTVWAEKELAEILANHVARNKRHDDERAEQYQQKLKQAELQAASDNIAEDDVNSVADEPEFSPTELAENDADPEQSEVVAEEVTEDVTTEVTKEIISEVAGEEKPVAKFDFEIELEEAELAEKEAAKKAKRAKKLAKAEGSDDSTTTDDSATADGSEEVNSIYLQKK